ncbi:efflux RND transporter permease subunit [Raineyella sp. LH-20]|uniref:efflux RND transporter permease subunit n=1 Tax=Raineyella sp. LH-20 TaxID=3081204 RepID=UPI002954AB8E|nr:efflux RND transporter permease subunit [Raineyella sp. LH-20]WOP19076.1 efflux RND transporter permease subunit [Raineyella sp. LH-20]
MGRLAGLSMRNRALVALVTVFVLIFGVVSTTSLRQELIPRISVPVAVVYASYPGASPEVVEQRVTIPIEQAVASLQGLDTSSSVSTAGSATVTLQMRYGSDMSSVQQDAKAAISRIEGMLPDGVTTQVFTGSVDDVPVIQLAVADDTTAGQLAERVRTLVVPELEKVDGVRAVSVAGAPIPQVLVAVDDTKLSDKGVTVAQLQRAIGTAGAPAAAGSLQDGTQDLTVTVGARYASASDVAAVTMTSATGAAVRVDQVATVSDREAPATSLARTNGRESLSLSVTKTPEGNSVAISGQIRDKLTGLDAALGHGAHTTVVFDQAPFISESIHNLLVEGGLGLLMAIVVILLFLASIRPTLVTAVSIPVSVLMALIGMGSAGYSLNMLTLGALTMAIGRVVDDSIVVIENIQRHLGEGQRRTDAVLAGVLEVATAITASTLTTVAVFLPLALVGGQVGELFRPFAITSSLALLASLLVALTIVPVLAYWFLPERSRSHVTALEDASGRPRRTPMQRLYLPTLTAATRHPVVTVLIAVVLLGLSGAMVPRLQTDFLGDTGQNTLTVTQKFRPALSLAEQDRQARTVEDALRGVAGVETVQTTIGGAGAEAMFTGGGADQATFSLTTDAAADQKALQQRVRDAVAPLTDVGDVAVAAQAGYGASTIDVKVSAPDTERLRAATTAVHAALTSVQGSAGVTDTLAADRPTIVVDLDRTKAAERGVDEQTVTATVKAALASQQVAQVESDGVTKDVMISLRDAPVGLEALRNLEVPATVKAPVAPPVAATPPAAGTPGIPGTPGTTGATGATPTTGATGATGAGGTAVTTPTAGPSTVRLRDVADVRRADVATSIARDQGQRSATVSVTPAGTDLGAVTRAVTARIDTVSLPAGASVVVGGVSADQQKAFTQLGLALLVAVAIVYVVMVATFKSLVQPLILLVSIPFAAIGAVAALVLTNTPLGVPSMIGALMLVGIVVTNAIVLIDLINQYRDRGRAIDDAVREGARHRLRPIVMTALATILAMAPMGLGLSGGGVFISKPLAIVVIGGLVSSTLLTLILVPVLYTMVERVGETRELRRESRLARRVQQEETPRRRRRKEAGPAAPVPPPAPAPVPVPVVADRPFLSPPGERTPAVRLQQDVRPLDVRLEPVPADAFGAVDPQLPRRGITDEPSPGI